MWTLSCRNKAELDVHKTLPQTKKDQLAASDLEVMNFNMITCTALALSGGHHIISRLTVSTLLKRRTAQFHKSQTNKILFGVFFEMVKVV